jgi:hypothetical protein
MNLRGVNSNADVLPILLEVVAKFY